MGILLSSWTVRSFFSMFPPHPTVSSIAHIKRNHSSKYIFHLGNPKPVPWLSGAGLVIELRGEIPGTACPLLSQEPLLDTPIPGPKEPHLCAQPCPLLLGPPGIGSSYQTFPATAGETWGMGSCGRLTTEVVLKVGATAISEVKDKWGQGQADGAWVV